MDFAGCGGAIPLTGFGNLLAKGTITEIQSSGLIGIFTGGIKAASRRNSSSSIFWIYSIISIKTKNKKGVKKTRRQFALSLDFNTHFYSNSIVFGKSLGILTPTVFNCLTASSYMSLLI